MTDSVGNGAALLEVRALTKRFGATTALDDVTLAVASGSVHAVIGENGAGKSTLGKVVAGVHRPDAGETVVDGATVTFGSPREALHSGIACIAQELALLPDRSIADNVLLGIERTRAGFVDPRRQRSALEGLRERVGLTCDLHVKAGQLGLADQQKVEVMRALARNARLIVMDEPTAALGETDTERLIALIRSLAAGGTTIVFISHELEEVRALADTITVLRDGRLIQTRSAGETTTAELIEAMIGRPLEQMMPERQPPADSASTVLKLRDVARPPRVHDASLYVREGEIVGIAGLIGSGRTELVRAVYGAERAHSGTIEVDGVVVRPRSPRDAIAAGMGMVPERRREQGLLLDRSLVENLTLPHLARFSRGGFVRSRAARREALSAIGSVDIRGDAEKPVHTLSGGNQQKVLFARWLIERPRLLIADEPTRGVDVGAKSTIYELLASLASEGMAVLLISSEMEELLGLAHRIYVMREGRIVDELDGTTASQDDVARAAFATAGVDR